MSCETELKKHIVLIDHVLEQDSPYTRWLRREVHVYVAHAGRDVTGEGWIEHIKTLIERDAHAREMMRKALLDEDRTLDQDIGFMP